MVKDNDCSNIRLCKTSLFFLFMCLFMLILTLSQNRYAMYCNSLHCVVNTSSVLEQLYGLHWKMCVQCDNNNNSKTLYIVSTSHSGDDDDDNDLAQLVEHLLSFGVSVTTMPHDLYTKWHGTYYPVYGIVHMTMVMMDIFYFVISCFI